MTERSSSITNINVKNIAIGLVMMAVFTFIWASFAYSGFQNTSYKWVLIIFPILCVLFIYTAFRLATAAKNLSGLNLANQDEAKKK